MPEGRSLYLLRLVPRRHVFLKPQKVYTELGKSRFIVVHMENNIVINK